MQTTNHISVKNQTNTIIMNINIGMMAFAISKVCNLVHKNHGLFEVLKLKIFGDLFTPLRFNQRPVPQLAHKFSDFFFTRFSTLFILSSKYTMSKKQSFGRLDGTEGNYSD